MNIVKNGLYILVIILLISCSNKPKIEVLAVSTISDYSKFSCETIKEMSIANIKQNVTDPKLDIILEGCKEKARNSDSAATIAVYNPEKRKYFYGTIHKTDLENVEKNCHVIGGAAAAIMSRGSEDLMMTLYRPGGRACSSIIEALKGDNPLIIINPVAVIGGEEFKRQGKKVLEKLDIYDDYKHATKALDKAARKFHKSFNDDLKSVTSWIKEDKDRALKYITIPGVQAAVEIVEKHHKKIEREAKNIIVKPIKKVLNKACYANCKLRHGSRTCKNRCSS